MQVVGDRARPARRSRSCPTPTSSTRRCSTRRRSSRASARWRSSRAASGSRFTDERAGGEPPVEFHYEGGIKDFVAVHQRVEGRRPPARRLLRDRRTTRARSRSRCSGTRPTRSPSSRSPTTSTRTRAARTSPGFRSALTSTINKYARDKGLLKEKEDNLEGEDVREGLAAVISVKLQDPQFEGQTKTKLGNPWVTGLVSTAVNQKLAEFFEENPTDARQIVNKAIAAAARAAGRAQGARADAAQVGARVDVAAGQARRLLDQGSRGGRALHRRGRQRRRLGQDGPRPHLPGDPAAAREDHQLREEPHQQGALEQRDPGDDHRDRHRRSATSSTSRSCATTA